MMSRLVVVGVAMSLSFFALATEATEEGDDFAEVISGLGSSPLEGYWVCDLEKLREDPRYESDSYTVEEMSRVIFMITPDAMTVRRSDGKETTGSYSVKEKKGATRIIEVEVLNHRGEKRVSDLVMRVVGNTMEFRYLTQKKSLPMKRCDEKCQRRFLVGPQSIASVPHLGADDPKVVIIESADFQCPFCSRAVPTLKKIIETYPDDVAIYFFQNPLGFHKQAMPAAKASLAAHRQGKFWPMHDKLFANMKALTQENFEKWASQLSLDVEQFKADMLDPKLEAEIKRQQAAMVALGARGTPNFFVNGSQVKGAQPFHKFKKEIDASLRKVNAAIERGKSNSEAWQEVSKAANPSGESFINWVVMGQQPPKAATSGKKKKRPLSAATVWRVTVSDEDPHRGGNEPLVTLVEFSDFECPYCEKHTRTMKEVLRAYGGDVKLVFKHNPLPFHKDAGPAAEASMVANEQGKFWAYHDLLFANQRALSADNLEEYAREVGLNMEKFRAAMMSGKYKSKIKADQKLAGEVSARGTPNTFVNGRQVTGARPFEDFKKLIDEELVKARALLVKGVARKDVYNEIIKDGEVFKPLADKVNTFTDGKVTLLGNPDAKVKVHVVADFQCPYSSRIGKPLKALVEAYRGDVAVVFKHFPLSFHEEAELAARASLAAGAQGKFWEYHDKLYAEQEELGGSTEWTYINWAVEMGLNRAQFEATLRDPRTAAVIERDMEEARNAGIRGTPTVYINGRRFQPQRGYSVASFKSVIDAEFIDK